MKLQTTAVFLSFCLGFVSAQSRTTQQAATPRKKPIEKSTLPRKEYRQQLRGQPMPRAIDGDCLFLPTLHGSSFPCEGGTYDHHDQSLETCENVCKWDENCYGFAYQDACYLWFIPFNYDSGHCSFPGYGSTIVREKAIPGCHVEEPTPPPIEGDCLFLPTLHGSSFPCEGGTYDHQDQSLETCESTCKLDENCYGFAYDDVCYLWFIPFNYDSGRCGWGDSTIVREKAIPGCHVDEEASTPPISGCLETEMDVKLALRTDNYPGETHWSIVDWQTDTEIEQGGPYSLSGNLFSEEFCLPKEGCYIFAIADTFGDGICCGYGQGSYNLEVNGETLVVDGGDFGRSAHTLFGTCQSVDATRIFTTAMKKKKTKPQK